MFKKQWNSFAKLLIGEDYDTESEWRKETAEKVQEISRKVTALQTFQSQIIARKYKSEMITFEFMGIYLKFVLANTEKFAVFSHKNVELCLIISGW